MLWGVRRYIVVDINRYMREENVRNCDAGETRLQTGSVDYVISNVSMEHIPKNDLYRILRQCHRILAPDGMLSVTVDYSDHWAHADRRLNPYSYMRYSDLEWEKYNPSMHYQNRLRHSDYRRILSENGFEIVEEKPEIPGKEAVFMLRSIELSEKFRAYDFEDLLITNAHFVARRI